AVGVLAVVEDQQRPVRPIRGLLFDQLPYQHRPTPPLGFLTWPLLSIPIRCGLCGLIRDPSRPWRFVSAAPSRPDPPRENARVAARRGQGAELAQRMRTSSSGRLRRETSRGPTLAESSASSPARPCVAITTRSAAVTATASASVSDGRPRRTSAVASTPSLH